MGKIGVRGARLVVCCIRYYQQRVSPRFGPRCRYEPSCSEYMRLAVERDGVARGVYRGVLRLTSCGPWSRRPYLDPP